MRKIRPLIDTVRIRLLCEPLYAEAGRPSIPPEQLFLAILGEYLRSVTLGRALVRDLTGNLVLRWFVGLNLYQIPWAHSTFSQNWKWQFTDRGLLKRLFDETLILAIKQKLISHHTTLGSRLTQANASHKSFVLMEVFLEPETYTKQIWSLNTGPEPDQDPGNPTVIFRGKQRSNQIHISTTDPDTKLATKGNRTAAMVGYTVNGLMKNQYRLPRGINVESFRGPASEMVGGRVLLDRFYATQELRIQTMSTDKGYFAKPFLAALVQRRIIPHMIPKTTGREARCISE